MYELLQEDFNIIETISQLDERFKIISCLIDKRIDNFSIITLKSISQYTGLSMNKVGSFIKLLEQKELIYRQCNGVFKLSNELLNLKTNISQSKTNFLSNQTIVSYRCNYDFNWSIQSISEDCFNLTQYTSNCLIENRLISYNSLISEEYRDLVWIKLSDMITKSHFFSVEYEIITASGKRKWVKDIGKGIFDSQGKVQALEGIIIDITIQKEYENYCNYMINHDIWTKLYNLNYLLNLLKNECSTTRNGKTALIVINFSTINFISLTYHFQYIQELIQNVSKALSAHCTNNFQLYNQFNRFAFYINNYKDRNDLINFINEISKTLLLFKGKVNARIGIIEVTELIVDVEQILNNVFIALEAASNNPEQSFNYYFFDLNGVEIIENSSKCKSAFHGSTINNCS